METFNWKMFKEFTSKFISTIGTMGTKEGMQIDEAIEQFEQDYPGLIEQSTNILGETITNLIQMLEEQGKVRFFYHHNNLDHRQQQRVAIVKSDNNANFIEFINADVERSKMIPTRLHSSAHIPLSDKAERCFKERHANNGEFWQKLNSKSVAIQEEENFEENDGNFEEEEEELLENEIIELGEEEEEDNYSAPDCENNNGEEKQQKKASTTTTKATHFAAFIERNLLHCPTHADYLLLINSFVNFYNNRNEETLTQANNNITTQVSKIQAHVFGPIADDPFELSIFTQMINSHGILQLIIDSDGFINDYGSLN